LKNKQKEQTMKKKNEMGPTRWNTKPQEVGQSTSQAVEL
jgi:hypothetical protein